VSANSLSPLEFDCILMDLHMPIVDGEGAARYIKSTNNKNATTPIIAVSAYSGSEMEASNLFAASLSKPLQKADLVAAMRQLGFKTAHSHERAVKKAVR
jgi:serine/threonine-protein kinase RIM15